MLPISIFLCTLFSTLSCPANGVRLKTVQAPPDDVDPLDDDENTDDDDPPSEAEVKAKVDEYLSAVRSANVEMSRPAAAGPPSKPEMKRAMSAGELTIRPTESDFVCPDECAECCLTKHFGFASHKRFKCVLRKPLTESATPPKGRNCDAVVHGSQKAPHQGKTHCKFNGNETSAQVWKQVSHFEETHAARRLLSKCSSSSRCCCNPAGEHICVGNQERAFGGTPLKLAAWSACPAGYSTYNIKGELCKCPDEACGKSTDGTRAKPDDPVLSQIASMMMSIYYRENPVSGWVLEKAWDVDVLKKEGLEKYSTDIVGIYRRKLHDDSGYACTLSISGTDDFDDLKSDAKIWSREFCGIPRVIAGFANEADDFMNGERFEEFREYLNNTNTCKKVYITGHSLGAALSYLVSACAAKRNLFKVDGVYTVAAPGLTVGEHLTYGGAENGCFPGYRFFIEDGRWVDPIATAGRLVGYWHVKTSPVRIQKTSSGEFIMKEYECGKISTGRNSKMNRPSPFKKLPSVANHLIGNYVKRLMTVSRFYLQNNASQYKVVPQLTGAYPKL